jgi:hypothetical protein
MGVDLTRTLAGVYGLVTASVKYSRTTVLHLLTEAAPDDPAGGTIRLATVSTGWKLNAPKNRATGERRERVTIALRGSVYAQPAGQPASPLGDLVARVTQYELHDPAAVPPWRRRYARAESDPRPRTATEVWRQDVVMSETEETPWHDPA